MKALQAIERLEGYETKYKAPDGLVRHLFVTNLLLELSRKSNDIVVETAHKQYDVFEVPASIVPTPEVL